MRRVPLVWVVAMAAATVFGQTSGDPDMPGQPAGRLVAPGWQRFGSPQTDRQTDRRTDNNVPPPDSGWRRFGTPSREDSRQPTRPRYPENQPDWFRPNPALRPLQTQPLQTQPSQPRFDRPSFAPRREVNTQPARTLDVAPPLIRQREPAPARMENRGGERTRPDTGRNDRRSDPRSDPRGHRR